MHGTRIVRFSRLGPLAAAAAFLLAGCRPSELPRTPDGAERVRLYPVVEEGKWGYMNHDGHLSIAPEFDAAWPFSEGLALVQKDGRFGYVDAAGDLAIPLRYRDAWYFSHGLAPVLVDTAWSFIDRSGEIVVNTSVGFDIAVEGDPIVEMELDRVRIDGRYGFRNAAGQIVIDPQFDQAWNFVDGLARVQLGGKWGFIDRSGAVVIEPAFDVAWDFDDGLARVRVGDRYGYIDTTGRYVWAPTA